MESIIKGRIDPMTSTNIGKDQSDQLKFLLSKQTHFEQLGDLTDLEGSISIYLKPLQLTHDEIPWDQPAHSLRMAR